MSTSLRNAKAFIRNKKSKGQVDGKCPKLSGFKSYFFINQFGWYVDILNWKYLFLPLEWIGMNAMLVYVMAAAGIFAAFINGWYYEDPHNTLNDDHLHGYNDAEVKLIALLVRHHRRKLPEYDHVVLEK
ncbi:hypothetical protein P3S68_021630 [Capsicum galapagoense]